MATDTIVRRYLARERNVLAARADFHAVFADFLAQFPTDSF